MAEGQVIPVKSLQQWKDQLKLGTDSKKLVAVDFTATWCGPCRFIGPVFADIAKKTPNSIFLKVDVDEMRDIAEEWGVEAMPTFIFFKDGKAVDKVVGAKKEELEHAISKHSASSS
ncbi:hypothetical protein PIB30_037031 [Stylosanthes scabra]|uniref:Thioredoxin domain-containing protein n=1 Tax=Stylosanthes scabra TaxID=79078 RepID=A0ABU6SDS5_9FABA|nr:hypothetical protein [Stylosanthes scabra]